MRTRHQIGLLGFGVFLLGVIAVPAFGGRPRPTQCVALQHWVSLRAAAEGSVACRDQALLLGSASQCAPAPPPDCSRSLVDDAIELAYGPASAVAIDPIALQAQFACQQQIGDAAAAYTWRRLRHRIDGLSPEQAHALASEALDLIPAACSLSVQQDTNGVTLPAVGPQCEAALGDPVDATALRDCLAQLLGVWVERIGPDPQPLRPNIVFILTDDQRWDSVGEEHSPDGTPVMPNVVSEIADSGVAFTNAFITSPLCAPARASILTGQYAHTHGVKTAGPDGGAAVFADTSTLATWLDAAGYRTALVGKYMNGYHSLLFGTSPPLYIPPGWDEWYAFKGPGKFNYTLIENGVEVNYGSAETDYSTDVLRDHAVSFVQQSVAAGEPFFLYFAPIAPHTPVIPAPRHVGLFNGLAPYRPPNFNELDVSDKAKLVRKKPLFSAADLADIDSRRQGQLEMLKAADEAVAALVQSLDSAGVLDDTILVFMSDNGYDWGEHRLRHKSDPYESAIRTPLIVRYPKLVPLPREEALFALNIDIAPTFAELAGATPMQVMDGVSLMRVLDGTAQGWRSDFLTEGFWKNYRNWGTVREARWKYTEWPYGAAELYDLEADPFELQSLHDDPAQTQRLTDMAARLREYRPEWPDDALP